MQQNPQDILRQLQRQFREQLPARLGAAQSLLTAYQEGMDAQRLQDLYLRLHSLSGSAGSFGAIEVGRAAREIELLVQAYIEKNQPLPPELVAQCEAGLAYLVNLAETWLPVDPQYQESDSTGIQHAHERLVYIMDDDRLLVEKLAALLQDRGYRTRVFHNTHLLADALRKESPSAVIADMVFSNGGSAGAIAIQEAKCALEAEGIKFPPIVFISVRDDIQARFDAMNAGGARYHVKPLDMDKLLNTIDGITEKNLRSPYRILVVDDDKTLLAYYRAVLEGEGMQVETISNPGMVFEKLAEFKPELIVLDVNMPQYTGPEIASMIRQDDAFAQLPIVFLTAQEGMKQKFAALNLGGDDYLTKPISAEYLASSILSRVKRSRWIKRLHDELQGALIESKNRMRALESHAIVSITDTDGVITAVNQKFCEISGYTATELVGKTHAVVNSGFHPREFFQQLWKTIASGKIWSGRICNRDKSGHTYWVDSTIIPFLDDKGKPYQYASVRTDITALIQQQEDLVAAKRRADDASQAKSEFLSSMSHELRTPMNAILGFSQLLEMHLDDNEHTGYVKEIIKAGNYLLHLINEVLDLARIEAGKVELSIEPVALYPVLRDCYQLISRLADERGITFAFSYNGKEAEPDNEKACKFSVNADSTRLKQVLLNLMSNAVKYNKNNGTISIECNDAEQGLVRISVVDTGIGISQTNLDMLFKSFNRLGQDAAHIEGTGIGLVITKNFVELMGGTIGVSSEEGKGSCFWIELPKHADEHHVKQNDIEVGNAAGQIESSATHTILYIEDNPINLKLINAVLGKMDNILLHSVPEPKLGIELAARERPDLILLDINLPGMHGHEVFKVLKAMDETRDIPVIAISANAMESDIRNALDLGFTDYVVKPINISAFVNTVNKHLGIEN